MNKDIAPREIPGYVLRVRDRNGCTYTRSDSDPETWLHDDHDDGASAGQPISGADLAVHLGGLAGDKPHHDETAAELLDRYRAASLSYEGTDDCDYIGAAGPVPDDEDEHALANIAEMHRVLLVRAERLMRSDDKPHAPRVRFRPGCVAVYRPGPVVYPWHCYNTETGEFIEARSERLMDRWQWHEVPASEVPVKPHHGETGPRVFESADEVVEAGIDRLTDRFERVWTREPGRTFMWRTNGLLFGIASLMGDAGPLSEVPAAVAGEPGDEDDGSNLYQRWNDATDEGVSA